MKIEKMERFLGNQNETFSSLLSTLQAEQMKIYTKAIENEAANSYGLSDVIRWAGANN